MHSRRVLQLFLVCVVAAGLIAAVPKYLQHRTRREVQSTRNTLRREIAQQIPVGSDPQHVLDFLTSRRIEHTAYESAGNDETALMVMGAPAIIEARVNVKTISLYNYSIHMVFKFDSEGRFVSYSDSVEGTFF